MSHEEEHRQLHAFFDDTSEGVFVDVGANDPHNGSTSWPFEKSGWNGIAVEPIPELADRLRAERRARVFNCACSNREEAGTRRTFHVHPSEPGWSSFHRDSSPWLGEETRPIEVDVRSLDDILEEAGIEPRFELLAMDVEFHEVEVLRGFDLERWKPQLIFLEDHVHDHDLLRYLESNGYRFYRRTKLNSWFVPVDSPHRPGWIDRYAFFRKYYFALPFRRIKRLYRG